MSPANQKPTQRTTASDLESTKNQTSSTDKAKPQPAAGARRKRTVALIIGGAVIVLLGIAWVTGHALTKDTLPAKASVRGVAIGRLSSGEAIQKLQAAFDEKAERPVELVALDQELGTVLPAKAGVRIDYVQTVRDAGASDSWNPVHIFKVLFGGGPTELVVDVDRERLATALQSLGSEVHREPVDAKVTLNPDGTIERTAMQVGEKLIVPTTLDSVRGNFLRQLDSSADSVRAEADVHRVQPKVTDQDAEKFIAEKLTPALSPITIQAGDRSAELGPEVLAAGMTVENQDGELKINVDVDRVVEAAEQKLDALNVSKATDAKVVIRDGRPAVVPSNDGQGVKRDDLHKVLNAALLEDGPRQASVEVSSKPAKFTTADAEKMQIREVTGEFTTHFPPSEYRNVNLGLVASKINGTLVKPGETFSLEKVTGPRNASTGYVPGGVLVGDHIEYVVGGGVSQSATTTYNAAFFAGMTDVEHHPHSQYFSQYPPGREATVFEGSLDLKFRNDTPYGVLVEAFVKPSIPDQGSITVRIWSTRYYDEVRASEPQISNHTTAPERVSNRPGCVPQSAGQGFDVKYQRFLTRAGQTQVQDYFWQYQPIPAIVCKS